MDRINVTKTFLPPLSEYQQQVEKIWSSGFLTNQGPLLKEFEQSFQRKFGITNFHFVGNGTIALQIALRALDITEGEIITTPFSYVATVSSILWERCQPVFVDIEKGSLCIDADKIEAAITKKTKAIMPVHVFGYPCNTDKIEAVAKKHNLKVIYDAAHAVGVTHKGRSLLSYGDISISSFHSTKLFHTIEGGCLIVKDKGISDKVELIKRFGHEDDDHFMLGINGKANEFQAAMGLCNLKYIDEIMSKRREVIELYDKLLGNRFERPRPKNLSSYNYAYYPILTKNEKELLSIFSKLNMQNVFPRRYFYPSLNTLPYLSNKQSCPISEDVSSRILCLPLSSYLTPQEVKRICRTIIK